MSEVTIYGIGNPLMDILVDVSDDDLKILNLDKGIMHLIDSERQSLVNSHLTSRNKKMLPGGSAPNTIVALGMLGVSGVLAGKVGADEIGIEYDMLIRKNNVRSELKLGLKKTGTSIIMISKDTERTMNMILNLG